MDAQRRVMETFYSMNGRDILMVAPTGSGKSLIFQISPFVIDYLRYGERENINENDKTFSGQSFKFMLSRRPIAIIDACSQVDGLMISDRKVNQLFVW